MWSLHVLPILAWVSPRCSGFVDNPKTLNSNPTWDKWFVEWMGVHCAQEREEGHPDIHRQKAQDPLARLPECVCPCEWHMSVLLYCCIVWSSCTSEGVCVNA